MYNEVKIGTKIVPMLSMASVDVYYRNIFHEDPIKLQATANPDAGDMINFVQRMGFVMAKFAALKDRKQMLSLTENDYLEWLDGFERMELMEALGDVQNTYNGQMVTTSEAKKNTEEPIGN